MAEPKLANGLKAARTRLSLTQADLAERVGVTRKTNSCSAGASKGAMVIGCLIKI